MKKSRNLLTQIISGLVLVPSLSLLPSIAHFGIGSNRVMANQAESQSESVADETVSETDIDSQGQSRLEILAEADLLYLQGDRAGAEKLYRQAKEPFAEHESETVLEPIHNLEEFDSAGGRVFWREAQAGWNGEPKLESRIFVPLDMLVEKHPEFVPAHVLLAEAHQHYDRPEAALEVLERAASLFPDSVEVVKIHVKALADNEKYLEAAVSARQFAIVHSEHPEAAELAKIADQNMEKFQGQVKEQMVGKGLLGGAISVATCGLFGGCNPVESAVGDALSLGALMLQGESKLGKHLSNSYQEQREMVEDEEVLAYVTKIGNDLAELMGRDDFEYEFYVIRDDAINAFALPGGKVFINTGIILNTNSEAEFAGLIAHELAHAVLSHSFAQFASNQLHNSVGQMLDSALGNKLPIGSIISTLISLDYSRSHERQADIVGTRVLATAGYAADGLRNLMVTLAEKQENSGSPAFLSTHPATDDRVGYLEELIQENSYNRYAFEGVEKHAAIQERLKELQE